MRGGGRVGEGREGGGRGGEGGGEGNGMVEEKDSNSQKKPVITFISRPS